MSLKFLITKEIYQKHIFMSNMNKHDDVFIYFDIVDLYTMDATYLSHPQQFALQTSLNILKTITL